MSQQYNPNGNLSGRIAAVIEVFTASCQSFSKALEHTDNLLDATDFTSVLHVLGFTAGKVRGLGEALTLLTGDLAWTQRADEVLAEYMPTPPTVADPEQN